MLVHTCSIKNSIRMQTKFIYDVWLTPAVGRSRRGGDFDPYFNSFPPLIGQLRLLITCHVKLVLTLIVTRALSSVYTCSPCCAPLYKPAYCRIQSISQISQAATVFSVTIAKDAWHLKCIGLYKHFAVFPDIQTLCRCLRVSRDMSWPSHRDLPPRTW